MHKPHISLLWNTSLISRVMDNDSIRVLHLHILAGFLGATLPRQWRHSTWKEPLLFMSPWWRMIVACVHNGPCLCGSWEKSIIRLERETVAACQRKRKLSKIRPTAFSKWQFGSTLSLRKRSNFSCAYFAIPWKQVSKRRVNKFWEPLVPFSIGGLLK